MPSLSSWEWSRNEGARRRSWLSWTSLLALFLFAPLGPACSNDPGVEDEESPFENGDGDGDGDKTGDGDGDFSLGSQHGDGDKNGDGDGDSDGTGGGCAESDAAADLVPTNLLFVVDRSGSMECNEPAIQASCDLPLRENAQQPSKWEITRSALVGKDDPDTADQDESGAIVTLMGTQGLSAGLITFPIDDFCAVPQAGELSTEIATLDEKQLDAFDAALDVTPDGETPLAGAAIRGLEALRRQTVAGSLKGNSYLVVMTDGVETCQPSALDDLKLFVEQARDGFDIKTFVVGAPGSEDSRALLSEIAYLGGTARAKECSHDGAVPSEGDCHVDLTESNDFAGDLVSVFRDILDTTQATCEFDVPQSAFVDPKKVNVVFTPGEGDPEDVLLDDADCNTKANGWQYTDDSKSKIVLCGDICDRVRADAGGMVNVVFGCRDSVIR